MQMNELAVVIPIWQKVLDSNELNNIRITLINNYDIPQIFVVPQTLNIDKFSFINRKAKIIKFPDRYFTSVQTYSELLLSTTFYERFSEFKNIIIVQTDAVLIKNAKVLTELGYPYIGSVWERGYPVGRIAKNLIINKRLNRVIKSKKIFVGNGGLSIRNVETMIEICIYIESFNSKLKFKFPEDVLISYFLEELGHCLPSFAIADSIFKEKTASDLSSIPDIFGFHALNKHNEMLEKILFANSE